MEYPTGRFSAVAATTVALIVALAGASDAQRRGRGAEPNPYLPLATDTIHAQPERFIGQRVTISAGVERVVSKTVFIVDQRRIAADGRTKEAIGRPLLVIAPTLNGTLDKAHYMLFVGELIAFSPEAVAARATGYALDMPAELQARYAGAPALLATSVVDSHYVDQAKRLITEEERALSLVMRRIGPAFTAMQRALDGTNAAAQVLESAETLKQGLLDSEVFWR
jgi:hypothetical protein